ncbi:MAG: hypothetical protein KAY24_00725 [Candidatus Eisenbacteria sp.]|nr:hypothetical protein [Candidatus Eisenbacteria bacterium]
MVRTYSHTPTELLPFLDPFATPLFRFLVVNHLVSSATISLLVELGKSAPDALISLPQLQEAIISDWLLSLHSLDVLALPAIHAAIQDAVDTAAFSG